MWLLYVIPSYTKWHYSVGIKDLIANIRNFLAFIFHFFSIGTLLRTLFSPWRRLGEKYKGGFEPSAFFSAMFVNSIMRLTGFVIRTFAILTGLFVLLLVSLCSVLVFFAWIVAPIGIFFLFSVGLANLFSQ